MRSSFSSSSVAVLLGLSLSVAVDAAIVVPRGLNRTTEAQEAAITNPTIECSDYTYEPVSKAAHLFPGNWDTAKIMPNDTEALAMWNSIQGKIPTNILPRGTPANSESGSGANYPPSDPDCWWTYTTCTKPKLAGLPDDIIDVPEPNSLGYGFDDGPDCAHNEFYNYLTAQNQKATMFYIGSNVQDYPLEAQRAITDGHQICVHTWSHQYMTSFPSETVFAELYYTMQMIKLVTGVTPQCWRPPYGDVDDRVRAVAHAMNLTTILWTYDSNDWMVGETSATPAQIDQNYEALIAKAEAGAFNERGTIILTHELTNFTMSEAIKMHPKLVAAFKYLVPVGVAYNWTQPYLEQNYYLPSFAQYITGETTSNGSSSTASNTVVGTASAPGSSGSAAPTSGNAKTGGALAMHAPAVGLLMAMLASVGGAMCAFA